MIDSIGDIAYFTESADHAPGEQVLVTGIEERARIFIFMGLNWLCVKSAQKMNTIIKLGMMVFALGVFSSLPGNAGTADLSYSKSKKGQQRATTAVSKSGVGVGQANQTAWKTENGVVVSTSFRHTRSPR